MQTPQDKQYIRKQPPELFYKKCALKNFAKFTGKHLCQSLFFNKVTGLRTPGDCFVNGFHIRQLRAFNGNID